MLAQGGMDITNEVKNYNSRNPLGLRLFFYQWCRVTGIPTATGKLTFGIIPDF